MTDLIFRLRFFTSRILKAWKKFTWSQITKPYMPGYRIAYISPIKTVFILEFLCVWLHSGSEANSKNCQHTNKTKKTQNLTLVLCCDHQGLTYTSSQQDNWITRVMEHSPAKLLGWPWTLQSVHPVQSLLNKSQRNKLGVTRSISRHLPQLLHTKIHLSELNISVKLAQNNSSLRSILLSSLYNLKYIVTWCLDPCCTKYMWTILICYNRRTPQAIHFSVTQFSDLLYIAITVLWDYRVNIIIFSSTLLCQNGDYNIYIYYIPIY